jgi:hypothetical protein
MNFKIGDLITFTYPLAPNTEAHDKYPKVLVLHNNWQGCVHGLNFNYLSADEINTVRMLIDPFFRLQQRDNLWKKNPKMFNEIETIMTKGSPYAKTTNIDSPLKFYNTIIRPFIIVRGWDPYRKYRVDKMLSSRILTPSNVMTGMDSTLKWERERLLLKKALLNAKKTASNVDKDKIDKMESELEKAQAMSQRKSVLTKFADFVKGFRGPRLPGFRK